MTSYEVACDLSATSQRRPEDVRLTVKPAKHFVVRYDHFVVHLMSDGPIDVHKLSVWVYSTEGHRLDKELMSHVRIGHHYVIHQW